MINDLTIPQWFIWFVSIFGLGGIGWASWVSMTLVKINSKTEFTDRLLSTIANDHTHENKQFWESLNQLKRTASRHSEEIAVIMDRLDIPKSRRIKGQDDQSNA